MSKCTFAVVLEPHSAPMSNIYIVRKLMSERFPDAAAGGAFRSGPGRLIFSTRELCQSIIEPDVATNKVCSPRPCLAGIDLTWSSSSSVTLASPADFPCCL